MRTRKRLHLRHNSPVPTHAHADIHERALQTLDFSDLRDEPPEDHSNPMAAIRDAVADLKDVQQRERAAEDSPYSPSRDLQAMASRAQGQRQPDPSPETRELRLEAVSSRRHRSSTD